jgi:3-oxoadipate enol-lactonase
MMNSIQVKGATLNAQVMGEGPPIVFLHGLGADMSVFDGLAHRLPDHKIIRFDLRGQGQSSVPDGPYSMGGMIAQGLAVKRLDLVRGMVLCATAAKFGQADPWHARAATARTKGMAALVDETLARWNAKDEDLLARARFIDANPKGYAASCEAIAGSDFYTTTAGLRLPTLGLCGDRDKSTPPDLVRETTDLVPGSTFQLIRGAGHLVPETHADVVAGYLYEFLVGIGHM